jgi:hypothetical protein
MHQTVNLAGYALRRFKSCPGHHFLHNNRPPFKPWRAVVYDTDKAPEGKNRKIHTMTREPEV